MSSLNRFNTVLILDFVNCKAVGEKKAIDTKAGLGRGSMEHAIVYSHEALNSLTLFVLVNFGYFWS